MKKLIPIIASIFVAATPPAFGQSGVDTLAAVVAADTSKRAATADTPAADTSANMSAGASADTSVGTSAVTGGAPVDTQVEISGNIYHDTLISASVNSAPTRANIDTSPRVPVALPTAPADTPIDTPAGSHINANTSEKIFFIPAYTFHVVFLALSAALIAATLYFFLTRRRDDSRRFLTTTRLSVLDKLVQRGCRHIESNYPNPALTPEAVCNSLVTGKAYLDALFMNELGINVQDFIIQVRVNAIKNRLAEPQARQSAADIDEICAECGFADRAEAERCFSGVCGGVGIAEFARFSRMQNQMR